MRKDWQEKLKSTRIKNGKRKGGTDMRLMRCVEYQDRYSGQKRTAILHSSSDSVVKFIVIRESAIDGVEYVDKKWVKNLSYESSYIAFINDCIDEGLILIPSSRSLQESESLADVIKRQKQIIGVDTINKKELIFLVGRVGCFEDNGFEIECVDLRGNAEEYNYYFKYSEVARLAVGGSYLKALNKWKKAKSIEWQVSSPPVRKPFT